MSSIHIEKFRNSLLSLKAGFKFNPSKLERDGLIKRFKLSVELSWKSAKKVLALNAIDTDTPKNVFREMAQLGWIDNPELWLEFIAQRNKASHIYNEEVAQEIFKIIPLFMTEAKKLVTILDKKK